MKSKIWNPASLILGLLGLASFSALGGESSLFRRTLTVTLKDPVILDIAIAKGDLTIAYSREGQVSIYAFGRDVNGNYTPRNLIETLLSIEQKENHIAIRDSAIVSNPEAVGVSYRIDVPLHTELHSSIAGSGKQIIVGITGPADVASGSGDIEATWVRFGLFKAATGRGKITCTRVSQLDVETKNGNITLMEDGPSTATVRQGTGMIEIGGARGTVKASTEKGEIHMKGVNWEDWKLTSVSGNIRIEVPEDAKFQTEIATNGVITVWRSDMDGPGRAAHHYRQTVNGGSKLIHARSRSGNISLE